MSLRFSLLDLNMPEVLERCWNLMCVVSRRKLGAQTGPTVHDAGSWSAAGRVKCAIRLNTTLKIHAVGSVCRCNTSVGGTCTV